MLTEVAEQLQNYLNDGGDIVTDQLAAKQVPITVYAEQTPNPAVMKFVANKMLVEELQEFKSIDDTKDAPLAKALFSIFILSKKYSSTPTTSLLPNMRWSNGRPLRWSYENLSVRIWPMEKRW